LLKSYEGDTYRAIYTVRFTQAVYVHVFQKKSPRRIQTRHPLSHCPERLKTAQRDYEERYG